MAIKEKKSVLVQDKKGAWWDVALYVPTVIFLLSIAGKMWYTSDRDWTYLLTFLATIFFLIGLNRILKVRMMILPGSPIAIDVNRDRIKLDLRSGATAELVKDVRYYPDFVGKSFAVSGVDLTGRRQQHVFGRGQFPSDQEFHDMRDVLRMFG